MPRHIRTTLVCAQVLVACFPLRDKDIHLFFIFLFNLTTFFASQMLLISKFIVKYMSICWFGLCSLTNFVLLWKHDQQKLPAPILLREQSHPLSY